MSGRSRHIASPAIEVRRKFWGRGVGTALMEKAIELAGMLGCRRLILGVFEGNERAMRLYKKLGFGLEAVEEEAVYIDGLWRKYYIMGLELSPCEPKLLLDSFKQLSTDTKPEENSIRSLKVRHLMDRDLERFFKAVNVFYYPNSFLSV